MSDIVVREPGTLNENAGKVLEQIRKRNGFTQEEMGGMLGVSAREYQRYMNGECQMSYEQILFLDEYFNVDFKMLIGIEMPKSRVDYMIGEFSLMEVKDKTKFAKYVNDNIFDIAERKTK